MIGEVIGLMFVIGFMLFCLVGVAFIIADSNYDKKRKDN
jgi:Na+/H+ antiporter NhaC